jgi:hypothetical protein
MGPAISVFPPNILETTMFFRQFSPGHITELSSLRAQLECWNNGFWENGTMGELVLDKVKY